MVFKVAATRKLEENVTINWEIVQKERKKIQTKFETQPNHWLLLIGHSHTQKPLLADDNLGDT